MRFMQPRPKQSTGRFKFPLRSQEGRRGAQKFGGAKSPVPFPQKPPYRPKQTGIKKNNGAKRKLATPNKPRTTSASWGSVATWYDQHLSAQNTYHEKVILPNLLRLVDAQKNERILDLACGQGFIARALAEKGASLTGIDISPELIAIAKKADARVTYVVGSAEDLSGFPPEHFDKTIIVLAIQNIAHAQKVFAEVARTIKHNGTFHIVMNHPAFRIPKRSSWAYDEKKQLQYRRIDQYLSESEEKIEMHPGMKDSPQTLSFHRPLQYYVKALVKAGFVIDRFEEWISHKESDSGPRAKAENRARKEIPLFLYVRAKKL